MNRVSLACFVLACGLTLQVTDSIIVCTSNSHCPSYTICVNNECVRGPTGTGRYCGLGESEVITWCRDNSTCDRGECTCNAEFPCYGHETCDNGICINRANFSQCYKNSECPGDEVCHERFCTPCFNSVACPAGTKCIDRKCRDPSYCTSSTNCPGSKECSNGTCVDRVNGLTCEDHLDCPGSQICKNGKCSSIIPTPDWTYYWIGIGGGTLVVIIIIVVVFWLARRNRPSPAERPLNQGVPNPYYVTTTCYAVPNVQAVPVVSTNNPEPQKLYPNVN